jgi:TPR repeat protein
MNKKDKWKVTHEDGLTKISEQELGHEEFMKAQNAISDGDYKTAIKEFESLAKKGHPIAQNNLGFEYLHGDRVNKDIDLGVYWLKKAAEQQVPDAEVGLGLACLQGLVVDKNYEDGVNYINSARKKGHKRAEEIWNERKLELFQSQTIEERITFEKELEKTKKNILKN